MNGCSGNLKICTCNGKNNQHDLASVSLQILVTRALYVIFIPQGSVAMENANVRAAEPHSELGSAAKPKIDLMQV